MLRLAMRLLLVAGVVGVVRQHREASERRAAGDGGGAVRPIRAALPAGPLAARVAAWVPDRPRTLLTRSAAAVWAAPLTMLGLALASVGRGRLRWDAARGCLVATGVAGPSSAALRLVGADANTVGQVVLCRSDAPGTGLLDHEAVHVRQAERLGPLLVPAYLWWNARHGYTANPIERAARRGAGLRAAERERAASTSAAGDRLRRRRGPG